MGIISWLDALWRWWEGYQVTKLQKIDTTLYQCLTTYTPGCWSRIPTTALYLLSSILTNTRQKIILLMEQATYPASGIFPGRGWWSWPPMLAPHLQVPMSAGLPHWEKQRQQLYTILKLTPYLEYSLAEVYSLGPLWQHHTYRYLRMLGYHTNKSKDKKLHATYSFYTGKLFSQCMLSNFACIFCCQVKKIIFSISFFSKNSFRNTIRVSNTLDPDQDWHGSKLLTKLISRWPACKDLTLSFINIHAKLHPLWIII